ncbi:hypothetical protein PAXRUDRAFT_550942 [Paxillus rubicundulus Ve08.2h10]|uniref:Uncharacterized protein n=1 Tax=Paxillus rubicundulus Ve08.2h10 TaxID=930991 RepID=A0A0D0DUP1_9AGAM|nr:hypothetical protein PAXRUDRAFT_550942 [Paxillus rubicundulus Ve08.2h10]
MSWQSSSSQLNGSFLKWRHPSASCYRAVGLRGFPLIEYLCSSSFGLASNFGRRSFAITIPEPCLRVTAATSRWRAQPSKVLRSLRVPALPPHPSTAWRSRERFCVRMHVMYHTGKSLSNQINSRIP